MATRLYSIRFRQGMQGVIGGFVEVTAQPANRAAERDMAERIGKQFCLQEPGRRFIRVEPAILADESILPQAQVANLAAKEAHDPAETAAKPEKPAKAAK